MAAKNCPEYKLLYESLKHCDGRPVLGGLQRRVLFQRRANVVKWAKLPADTVSMETAAVLVGDITLAMEEKWHYLELAKRKGKFSSKPDGEAGSKTVINEAEFPLPDNDEYVAGFSRISLNDELIYLVEQMDHKWRLLGSEDFDVETTCEMDSGEQGGAPSNVVKVSARDYCEAPFYTGKIETDEGVIQGAPEAA